MALGQLSPAGPLSLIKANVASQLRNAIVAEQWEAGQAIVVSSQ